MTKRGEVPIRFVVDDFAALARDLRRAGARGLTRELNKGLQRTARPTIKKIRESALATLPNGGGLAERVSKSTITARGAGFQRGGTASIRFKATEKNGAPFDAERIDGGRVRHPTFGHRPWRTQKVPPGWFTKPLEANAKAFEKALEAAVDAVEKEISGG